MKKQGNMTTNDDKIRSLISGSKITAGENLKFRIMQQIQMEHALSKKAEKQIVISKQIKNILTIGGIMYALIGCLFGAAYFYGGREALFTTELYMAAGFVTIIAVVIGSIFTFDEKLQSKLKEKQQDKHHASIS